VSGALAILRAADPARVLAMEYDRLGALAAALGRKPGFDPTEVAPGLWTMVLDGAHQLEEYLSLVVPSRALLRAVISSGAYRYFVDAAPGLRELIMIGKIYHEVEYRPPSPPWDLVVLDAPATGQALSVLRMPLAARATFGAGIAGRTAARVSELLRDTARCGVVLVTSPEPFAVSETLEAHAALGGLGLDVAAVIFNRTRRPRFDAHAVARLTRRPALRAAAPHLDGLAALAHAELRRASGERRALELVRRRIGAPIIELAECRGVAGLALMRELARQLAALRASEVRAQAPVR
ncbi:MAG TPA: ArsA-related P-loop ATPase, partial [Candidatus Binataceae bacterium]|nr:ArsA-related P-loop ATPase [Candidatus Binataceae bacterium]